MGANIISCFLYPIRFNSSCLCCNWTAYTISLPHYVCTIFFRVFKLISEPISVLLEDEGGETSGEGYDQRILVFELIQQTISSSSKQKLMLIITQKNELTLLRAVYSWLELGVGKRNISVTHNSRPPMLWAQNKHNRKCSRIVIIASTFFPSWRYFDFDLLFMFEGKVTKKLWVVD